MAKNNIHYKMTHILNVNDVFTFTNNNTETYNVYIDIDSTSKLLNIAPLLYKNVPSLRPKIIQASKSYTLNKTIYDLLDSVNSGYNTSRNIDKIYIVSDDESTSNYIKEKQMNVVVISNDQFNKIVHNDNDRPTLFVDVNELNAKKIKHKKNMHIMLLQLVK
jgi:hypothetical protein